MDKFQKIAAGIGAAAATVLGVLVADDQIPLTWHKWLVVGLSVLTALGLGTKKVGASGDAQK
jgi:hypothetical protein